MIALTFFFFIVAFIVYEKYTKIKKTNLPGPRCIPFIGNALEFGSNEDALYILSKQAKKYGDIFRIWLGSDLYIILKSPEDIEVLLSSYKHTLKALSYKFIKSWLGNGLITSHGDIWRAHRKLLTPTFHFKILENSVNIIYRHANVLKNRLEQETESEKFDIHAYIEKCSFDIICETAMGINMNIQSSDKGTSYLQAVKSVTNISVARIFKAWLQPDLFFKLSGYSHTFEKNFQIMENVSKNVIISRRKKLLEKNETEIKESRNKPFLDFLLTESQFTDTEIHDEVQSFMFAGHDTTTSAICFCISQIAKHPDVQEKIYEEVRRVLPDDDSHHSLQNHNNLRYLENVIKETLRLFPAVPMIGRTLLEDVILPSGHKLPAHSHINIFIYDIQRSPKIFQNPNEFIPERFDDKEIRKHAYAYIPFSAGPRNCIGQKLAMLEIKIVLATLIRNYLILPTNQLHSITLSAELILRTKEGIPVKIRKRVY